MRFPAGINAFTSVAVDEVHDHATAHRPGPIVSSCGQPMWAFRLLAADEIAPLTPRWCTRCFPPTTSLRTAA